MKKERLYTGYAVVSMDILDDKKFKKGAFGVTIKERDLETCKRYCYSDSIIVRTYRDVYSKSINLRWVKKYQHFRCELRRLYNPRFIQFYHLRIEFETQFYGACEREIIYQPEATK